MKIYTNSDKPQEPQKLMFSRISHPEEIPSRGIYCPRWLQPLVFWVLRKLDRGSKKEKK